MIVSDALISLNAGADRDPAVRTLTGVFDPGVKQS
jgi:hypothetical protein